MVLSRNRYLLTALLACSVLASAMFFGWFRHWRESLIDFLYTIQQPPAHTIIVEIDETSIAKIGRWPFARTTYGTLVMQIAKAGPAVIGIDINFKEASQDPAEDEQFANAIAEAQMPIVLTAEIQTNGKVSLPVSSLSTVASEGFPNIFSSSDGVVRATRFFLNDFPSFSTTVAQAYYTHHKRPKLFIPLGATRIAYAGPARTFPYISAIDVLDGKIPASFFKDRIVLIGATARDLQDYHKTPMGLMSGVEIQASVVRTLIDQTFYTQLGKTSLALTIFFALLAIVFSLIIHRPLLYVLTIFFCMVIYTIAVFFAFDARYVIDLLYPNLAFGFTGALVLTVQYSATAREKKLIQETFSRYLAPQVIDELIKDPAKVSLGGQKRNLSILFSDIRGFTSFSETMSPERLTRFLNDYLTTMSEIILERHGVIDKYIGDAIMAFWGAPLENPHHAPDAVAAAVAMIDSLHNFNRKYQRSGNPPINIGIGINTGDVTVGNMGSERRFDYTVMGDAVNLASRLEGLSKLYGVQLIIGESTRDQLHEHQYLIRELDRVHVKGKKNTDRIFEIIPHHTRKKTEQILEIYNEGRELYYQGRWDNAIIKFEQILIMNPEDGPTKLLRERCLLFKRRPPEEWEGVFEHTDK